MTEVSSTYSPVLFNEYGEEIITGTGSAYNLPSGFYFIQAGTYDIGGAKFKEAKLSKLEIYAVDPNAAPNPITPPPTTDPDQGGDSGNTGGDNTGSGDNTGGGNQGGGNITVPVGSYTHSVTENGTTDPNGFFTLSGDTSGSKGDVILGDLTLTECLKVSSKAYIKFTAPADGKVTLVFNSSCAGFTVTINGGDPIAIPSDGILTFDVKANTAYEILKKKSESFLYYLVYTPNELPHTHSYIDEETKEATCTEAGIITYTCECGDSYTENVAAKGHSFTDGFCTDCGIDDPDYVVDNPGGNETPENPENDPQSPENPVNPEDPTEPEPDEPCSGVESPTIFEIIWGGILDFFEAIGDFFAKLFGIKKD